MIYNIYYLLSSDVESITHYTKRANVWQVFLGYKLIILHIVTTILEEIFYYHAILSHISVVDNDVHYAEVKRKRFLILIIYNHSRINTLSNNKMH